MGNITEKLSHIRDGFATLDGQDRLVYLIDLGKRIDLIDETDKIESNKVHACTSQTWVKIQNQDTISITVDSESSIVKGLLRILQIGFNNEQKKNIIDFIDDFDEPIKIFEWLNIGPTISSQRQNGFIGALLFIKKELINE
ncbi:MAG: SufE family protein [bacterium]|jgi:cysteine desulfuration protein SufE|nr:SufE family protein [Candidatus Neomarinimicrobiota bacterium]HIL86526.1 SufE family protein [Candidatus Neomarinimicrobiota bacterium]